MTTDIPARGFVFWPVGTGDCTTICVESDVFVQVDLHHMVCADDDEDVNYPVVSDLIGILPKVNERPYLAAFASTHGDKDHCCGFADLLKKVTIGELWFTPQIFVEALGDLCDDAIAFRREAIRRVKATVAAGGVANAGDRIRIFGWDEVLKEPDFVGLPSSRLTIPGSSFTDVDGRDLAGRFRAFVHAPFREDIGCDRNDSSLGLQISLFDGYAIGRALLLGDLCYPTVKRIFDLSDLTDVAWNVFLAPHHCSKSVMYWQDSGEDEPTLKQNLISQIETAAQSPAHIVASSAPIPAFNGSGDNPPHAKAKARYQEIAPNGFLCTMEHPNASSPSPIIFTMTEHGLVYRNETSASAYTNSSAKLGQAIAAARGAAEPPKDRVGFGRY